MKEPDATASARSDLDAWRTQAERNAFDADLYFRRLLERHLGASFADCADHLREVAAAAGSELDALVLESGRDENLPTVRQHDAVGRPIEEVVFHPACHVVGRVFWGSGVLSVLEHPGNEVLCGAIAYLLDQHGEAGHACPVACTAGAIKLIQRLGTEEQKENYLPALLESDYGGRLHAAQFVTEVQGGSDVGSNACSAVPDAERPGWYQIFGEKWFCSVADAGLFVVSARLEGGPEGTGGLGLFLVPRIFEGEPNGFTLRRLKYKLGTRSMATGEFEFDGALGQPIGPLDHGFRNLVGIVLDTSRVHNAVAACGIMRRSFVEAVAFATHRRAFERRIIDFPAVQQTLAAIPVRTAAALATTFRILAMTDRLDTEGPDRALTAARRIAVMINKYWTALAATGCARDGIEVLGGNGTIEDFSVLPRLYRDAIVVESWEGTHNTLCAQVLRDFAARGLHRPWLDQLQTEIDAVDHPRLDGPVARARQLHAEVTGRIDRLLDANEETAAAHIRHVVDRMCRITDWVSLLEQGQWELRQNGASDTIEVLELYRLTALDPVDPQESPELIELRRRVALQE